MSCFSGVCCNGCVAGCVGVCVAVVVHSDLFPGVC